MNHADIFQIDIPDSNECKDSEDLIYNKINESPGIKIEVILFLNFYIFIIQSFTYIKFNYFHILLIVNCFLICN